MAKIQTIKNSESTIIYPQTHTKAVFDADNIDLQTHLDAYLKTEDVGAVENISDIPELQINKVTTVNENSTDVQYPSAKAVYDAIINNKEVGVKIEIFATKEEIISPDTATIYLIGNSSPYEEYLYLGNNKWELIGTTKIDLSDYLTITAADEKYAKLSKYEDTRINIGRKTGTNSGDGSVAEGYNVTANGRYSHAEGHTTIANEQASHAEGYYTNAWGPAAHTEGDHTRANGQAGHAEGYNTTSQFMSQHVQGEYNIVDPGSGTDIRGTYAHIVGNGNNYERSNAHTLDWRGNAWFQGDVYIGSTSGINKDEGSKKLATEELVINKTNGLATQEFVNSKITYGTTTLEDGVSELATGTLYVVYEE